jgi:hypothetical protein
LRADAAAPAAPVGAHARARARNHVATMCTAVSRSTFDLPVFKNLIDIPCCSGSTSTLRRRAWRARYSFDIQHCRTGAGHLGTGDQQVCSHLAPGSTRKQHALSRKPSLAPSIATESTLVARAGVYRSARLWARWNRAALPSRVFPLKLGCRARKRVVWSSGRKRLRVGCPRPLLALRSLWGGLGTVPGPSLGGRRPRVGGALRRQGRRSSRGRLSRAYPPWAASPRSSAWRGGGVKIGNIYGTVFFRLRIV